MDTEFDFTGKYKYMLFFPMAIYFLFLLPHTECDKSNTSSQECVLSHTKDISRLLQRHIQYKHQSSLMQETYIQLKSILDATALLKKRIILREEKEHVFLGDENNISSDFCSTCITVAEGGGEQSFFLIQYSCIAPLPYSYEIQHLF